MRIAVRPLTKSVEVVLVQGGRELCNHSDEEIFGAIFFSAGCSNGPHTDHPVTFDAGSFDPTFFRIFRSRGLCRVHFPVTCAADLPGSGDTSHL